MTFVRSIWKRVGLILAGALLVSGLTATAEGKNDPTSPLAFSIIAPESIRPGEIIPVTITTTQENGAITATLFTPDKKVVIRSRAVSLGGNKKDGYKALALLPLNTVTPSGVYHLAVHDSKTGVSQDLRVKKRTFIAETLPLGEQNTAIKTDTSKERMKQIKKLTTILQTVSANAPRFPGPFALPVTSSRRTSHFGDRRTFLFSDGKTQRGLHYGIDFGIPTGTPVCASGDGHVVLAEFRITTGWTVVIEHFPGVYSLYYHLESLNTTEDEFVRTGARIGNSGSTGLATGPHLHWEFRVQNVAVDPDWFVGRVLF